MIIHLAPGSTREEDHSSSRLAVVDDPVVPKVRVDVDVLARLELLVGNAEALVVHPDDLYALFGDVDESHVRVLSRVRRL